MNHLGTQKAECDQEEATFLYHASDAKRNMSSIKRNCVSGGLQILSPVLH